MSRLGFLKLLFVTFVDISRAWLVSNVLQIGHLFKYRLEFLVIETVLFFASFSCWKQAIVFSLILLPFTKWKINYTPTKTLASNNQESWGEVHSERRNLIANKIRKYEKERKSASQLNAHMHIPSVLNGNVTRASAHSSNNNADDGSLCVWGSACVQSELFVYTLCQWNN